MKAWPVKYQRMFDMTNDSHLFLKGSELKAQGWRPAALNRWEKTDAAGTQVAVPLYEGKMVQMFDHRAADVVVNEANLKRAAQQEAISATGKGRYFTLPRSAVLWTLLASRPPGRVNGVLPTNRSPPLATCGP